MVTFCSPLQEKSPEKKVRRIHEIGGEIPKITSKKVWKKKGKVCFYIELGPPPYTYTPTLTTLIKPYPT